METRKYVADELLERLDGLLADVRALHTELHQLSTSAAGNTAAPTDTKTKSKKKSKSKKSKKKGKQHKKQSKARND